MPRNPWHPGGGRLAAQGRLGRGRDGRRLGVQSPAARGRRAAEQGPDAAGGVGDERPGGHAKGVQQWQQAGQLAVGVGVGQAPGLARGQAAVDGAAQGVHRPEGAAQLGPVEGGPDLGQGGGGS